MLETDFCCWESVGLALPAYKLSLAQFPFSTPGNPGIEMLSRFLEVGTCSSYIMAARMNVCEVICSIVAKLLSLMDV